jgi:ketosteroid isomerase-like protein
MSARMLPTLALVLCALAFAAGCAGDDEDDVREALESYATAVEKKDYQAICDDILSEKLIEKLRSANLPCEVAFQRGLRDVKRPRITVRSVKLDGDTASAVARTEAQGQKASEDTIELAKESGKWKIFALSSSSSETDASDEPPGT